jgi:hypothetical protein
MKKIKTVYIHIGTPKTGTTSIQDFFAKNREPWGNKNVYYPECFARFGGIKADNHIKLSSSCSNLKYSSNLAKTFDIYTDEEQQHFYDELKKTFLEELSKTGPSIDTIVCSNEHLCVQTFEKEDLFKLKKLFSDVCDNIKIIIYLRKQDAVTVSSYTQKLKTGYAKPLVLDQLPAKWKDYYKLIKFWESVFGKGNVVPRIFAKDKFYEANLVLDFIHTCKLSERLNDSFKFYKPANESLDNQQCELLLELNQFVKSAANDKKVSDKLRSRLVEYFMGVARKDIFDVSLTDKKMFMDKYLDSNEKLAKEYFDTTLDELF